MAQGSISNAPRTGAGADFSSGIARLLGHRYGDGLVYFRDKSERSLFELAVARGLISPEGYLTPEGHSFLAVHGDD